LQLEEETNAYRISKALMRSFLDKHTQTYDHLTYTALPVLELFQDNRSFDILLRSQAEMIIALICDLIRYELKTLLGQEHRMQEHLPQVRKLKQRIYVAVRAIVSCHPYADHLILPSHLEHLIELWQLQAQHEETVSDYLADETFALVAGILEQMEPQQRQMLDLTLIPVYVAHDEYLFLRILQTFEMMFHVVAEGMRECVGLITAERYQLAAERFHLLNDVLRLSPALFRILSTMTSATFNGFREYMKGASALQSEYYKKIELYASHPDPQRFRSPSFDSVPRVTREYQQSGFVNLQDIVTPLLLNGSHKQHGAIQAILAGMQALDATFVTWKVTHYRLVKALIGDAPGTSGQTSGTPYLKLMLEMPLFPYLKPYLPESAAI
jgi:tryptophan 2,3-dioxygenase